jgi:predicted transcriptional regulator
VTNQPTLFDGLVGTTRHSDPFTSHQAALDNAFRAGTQRVKVLVALAHAPAGLTDYELSRSLEMHRGSASKRRGELEECGLVERTGMTRPTDTGSKALVHRLTDAGWRAADRSQ